MHINHLMKLRKIHRKFLINQRKKSLKKFILENNKNKEETKEKRNTYNTSEKNVLKMEKLQKE